MEFGIHIPGIPLPEKSQKECGLRLLGIGDDLSLTLRVLARDEDLKILEPRETVDSSLLF